MFGRTNAYQQYAKVGVESKVLGASDHRLIALLFDGAIECIDRARAMRAIGNRAGAAEMIGRSRSIVVEGLRACLDRKRGGEIAEKLDQLYDYIVRRLIAAGAGDERGMDEAQRLLQQLRDTWAEIDPDRRPAAAGATRGATDAYATN